MYKTTPTFDDWQKKVDEYGFTVDQISEADRNLAMRNPEIGIKMLDNKNVWLTSTNDSAKAWAHALNEDYRKLYGDYSGGTDGGSYTPTGTAQYEDPWEVAVQSTIKNMQNRKFEWSPETDPSAKYYTDMYRREGERAMKDTLGTVAATTGGIPSSYATAAAAQQRNYYAQALTDKYPELYKQAFDRFMQEYDNEYKMLDAYATLSEQGYGRWSDTQERNRNARLDAAAAQQQAFENQVTTEELAIQQEQAKIMKQEMDLELKRFDYEQRRDAEEMAWRWADLIQQGNIEQAKLEYQNSALELEAKDIAMKYAYQYAELDYQKDALAEESRQSDLDREQRMIIALIEEELARDQLAEDISARELEEAVIAAGYGDFTKLENLDIDTEMYREAFEKAMQEQMEDTGGTEEDMYVEQQTGGVSNTNPFNQPNTSEPDFIETPAMVTPNTITDARRDKANEGKNAQEIAESNYETKQEIKAQQTPDALYERFLNGGQLTASELVTVQKKYGKEMQSAQVLYRRYQSGGTLTAAERKIVENAYGANVFKYGNTYGMK